MAHKFVGLPQKGRKVYLYGYYEKKGVKKFGKVRQVLWGDFLSIDEGNILKENSIEWLTVNWAPSSDNPQTLYIEEKYTSDKRPLEIIFLDVGQGDGAVLITPERNRNEKIIIIDAGENDNMHNFIDGRFKAYRGFDFDAAIITHPDKDHYLGFKEIFANQNIGFKTIFHNGLVERAISGKFEKLGGLKTDNVSGIKYVENLPEDRSDMETHFLNKPNVNRYKFPPVIINALNNPKIGEFKMLSTDKKHCIQENNRNYMPGLAPSDNRGYSIEVLGPIVERKQDNTLRLRKLGNYGETKNGHSIILRLHFGKFKVLFGGDLNIPAEKFLLKQYTKLEKLPKKSDSPIKYADMLKNASAWFKADIMKVCHHGSEKVTDEFLKAVNPACFVISSGDREGHVHPRPDLLGRLGKMGRGKAPVILSTELQRSTREKEDKKLIKDVYSGIENITSQTDQTEIDKIKNNIKILSKTNVDVYGSIYLKTDGDRLITAFKIESGSSISKWFYFEYKIDTNGNLKVC